MYLARIHSIEPFAIRACDDQGEVNRARKMPNYFSTGWFYRKYPSKYLLTTTTAGIKFVAETFIKK
jgi:hypothetical protein